MHQTTEIENLDELRNGDEVWWNDPDDGACSRSYIIRYIEVKGDIVCISSQDGEYLECFASELA